MTVSGSLRSLSMVCLSVAALAQATILGVRAFAPREPAGVPQRVENGREVGVLKLADSMGAALEFNLEKPPGSRPTALLAFHSECGWCERAAPIWKEWMANQNTFDVIAVTSDEPTAGLAYARGHEWDVRVLFVNNPNSQSIERRLVNYTPWIFIFDSAGKLLHQQNGGSFDGLAELVGE